MMAAVLLIEDEDSLRETLRRYLVHEGHEVVAVASGGEALDVGIGFCPDVLVADWMLKNHIHGLHVSQIFRALHPALNTILITGFPSSDLLEESNRSGVMRLLEKPFDLTDLEDAVKHAETISRRPEQASDHERATLADSFSVYQSAPVAALAVNLDGVVEFVSARAEELCAVSGLGRNPINLEELLGPSSVECAVEAESQWLVADQPVAACGQCWVRSRPRHSSGGWIIVLVPPEEEQRRSDPRVRLLLDDRNDGSVRSLAASGPVLVIEQDSAVRRLLVSQVERSGALCYPSDDFQSAIRLLVAEPQMQAVLVDCSLAGAKLASWSAQIRAARPEATIIGTGAVGFEASVLAAGIEKVLRKPWRMRDLVDVIDS